MLHSWWSRLFFTLRHPTRRTLLSLETLEDRLAPAVLTFNGGFLDYQAGPGVANNVSVDEDGQGNLFFTETAETFSLNGSLPSFHSIEINSALVTLFQIHLGDGNNQCTVNGSGVPIAVFGGKDTDQFQVGSNNFGVDNFGTSVTINGGTGNESLTVEDSQGTKVSPMQINDSYVSTAGVSVGYSNIQQLVVNVNLYRPVRILGTSADTNTTVNLHPGENNNPPVDIGNAAGSLNDLQGPLQLNTTLFNSNQVAFHDFGEPQGHVYTFNAAFDLAQNKTVGSLTRDGDTIATVTGRAEVTIEGGTGPDLFIVHGNTHPVHLVGNGGDDLAIIGSAHGLDTILDLVTFDGGASATPQGNQVHINDSQAASGHAYTTQDSTDDFGGQTILPSTEYLRDGTPLVAVTNTAQVLLDTSNFDDTFTALLSANDPQLVLSMNNGTDTLKADNFVNQFYVTGHGEGKLIAGGGTLTFSGVENLQGGAGPDTFHFTNQGRLNGFLDGGASREVGVVNTLDYSACTKDVKVNLTLHTATGVRGMVTNIRNVTGGKGNDLLVGDNLANVLIGGSGNDVLIGGGGGDTLIGDSTSRVPVFGSKNSDLLIAGTTVYDSDPAALNAIFKEWAKSGHSYAERITHLRHGVGLNHDVFLNNNTVSLDRSGDQLTGGSGLDWFWANLPAEVLDLQPGEVIN